MIRSKTKTVHGKYDRKAVSKDKMGGRAWGLSRNQGYLRSQRVEMAHEMKLS